MRPLLEGRLDPLPRALLYVPVSLALGLVLFFLVGLLLPLGFAGSLVLGLVAGFAAALGVTGPPLVTVPEERRGLIPWLYFPLAVVVFLLGYLVLGIVYTRLGLPVAWSAYVPLVGAVVLGLTVPYPIVGFPSFAPFAQAALGRVPEDWWDHTPWLFFPLAIVFAFVAYLLVGLAYTASPLPTLYLTQVSVILAVLVGPAVAYLLVGIPEPPENLRHPLHVVPEESRPWLFLPLGLVFTLLLFFLVGVAYTSLPVFPLDAALPLALVASVLLGFGAAYALVGVPTPERPAREYAPDMPPAARPVAFVVALLVAGPLLAFVVGLGLAQLPVLPQPFFLPLTLILGYLLAFGLATLAWGVPGRWKGVPAPGLPEDARLALVLPLALVLGAFFTFLVELLTPIPLVPSVLVGGSAGVLVALYGTGATDRLQATERETLLPELPETVKPLVFLPTWAGVATLVTFLLGYGGISFTWGLVVGLSLGFALALAVVEEPLLREALGRRREEKARKERLEQRRQELLEGER
jgi:hypothetical protein